MSAVRESKTKERPARHIVKMDRGEIHCDVQGEGPVVCLMATLGGSWAAQARLLRDRYTVLTYSMRGYGESRNFEQGFPSNEGHATDLESILDHLGLDRVVLVGLSHGGAVAQHFAAAYPSRLRGLAIVSSFAYASGSTRIFLELLHGFLKRGDLATFWEVLRAFLCSEENFPRLRRMESSLKSLMFDQYTCESLLAIYESSLRHDTRALLPNINVPTLVVGGQEDMLFPPRITAELTSLIPHAEECLLPTAHVPPVEDLRAFHATLSNFLDRLN
jgi:3-oxoadipate enol-lactonase